MYQLFSSALSCHVVYGCKLNIWLSGACLMLPPSILCIIELCFVPPSSPEFQREHSYSWGTLTVSMVQQYTTQANKLSRIWNMFKLVWCIMKNNSNLLQFRLWQYWLWSFKFLPKKYQILFYIIKLNWFCFKMHLWLKEKVKISWLYFNRYKCFLWTCSLLVW